MNREDANPTSHRHPTADTLAALADLQLGGEARMRALEHVRQCEECRSILEYVIRVRALRRDRYEAEVDDPELRAAVEAIATRDADSARAGRRAPIPEPFRRWHWPKRAWRTALAIAGASALTALGIWRLGSGRFDPDAPGVAVVTRLLVERSEQPGAIFPGLDGRLRSAAEYRSSHKTPSADVDSALASLARRVRVGSASPGEARWLIAGYLATDQLALARSTLALVTPQSGKDPDLRVLAAILEARDGDASTACGMLRADLRTRSRDWTTRYDLAVSLAWSGQLGEAGRQLDTLRGLARRPGQFAKIEQLERSLAAREAGGTAPSSKAEDARRSQARDSL